MTKEQEDFIESAIDDIIINSMDSVDDDIQQKPKRRDYDGNKTSLQKYFEEVGRVYDRNNNDYNIEFCPENRDKLIEMNLKCVIKFAKRYKGMGLSLEELISAGNEGLCVAFDKYDPNRNLLREELIKKVHDYENKEISLDWIVENIGSMCKYGKLKKRFEKAFSEDKMYKRSSVESWVKKNVPKASFNSVAMMWVNAAIHQELDNYSRLIRKPKTEIEKEKSGESVKEVYININAPINDDSNNTVADVLVTDDEQVTDMDVDEAHSMIHDTLKILFKGVKTRDRRIVLQRYGVGYVRPMLPKEISERENISIARVSQIINITLTKMKENATESGINPSNLFQSIQDIGKVF